MKKIRLLQVLLIASLVIGILMPATFAAEKQEYLLAKESRSSSGGSEVTEYTYDSAGQLIRKSGKYGSNEYYEEDESTYQYDEKGNLISEIRTYKVNGVKSESISGETKYDYDDHNNVIRKESKHSTYTETSVYTNSYDSMGRLSKVSYDMNLKDGEDHRTTVYRYDGESTRILTETITNTTDSYTPAEADKYTLTNTFTYDEKGNVLTEVHTQDDAADPTEYGADYKDEYIYDENGNIIQLISYDAVSKGQYAISSKVTTEYDSHGNRTKETEEDIDFDTTYTYNFDNTYDENGNLIKIHEVSDGHETVTTYEYIKNPAYETPGTPAPGGQENPSGQFSDVPSGAYYFNAIQWAVDQKITTGTTPTTFNPDDSCTRAQAVTFLWRAAGSPAPSSNMGNFVDVSSGQYYTEAISWAVENGIVRGTTDTTFNPNGICDRAQIVTMLYRLAGNKPASAEVNFTDVPAGQYFYAPVQWAVAENLTNGTTPTTFNPEGICTRAQIVTFLYRYMVPSAG